MHIIQGPRQLVTSSFLITISYCSNILSFMFYERDEEIYLIRNFYPSRARNFTTIISKLNNFAEVLAVRVHVDVYMATPALRSLTHETLCDTGQRTADTLKFTNHHLPTTKSHHFKPSILAFLRLRRKKS